MKLILAHLNKSIILSTDGSGKFLEQIPRLEEMRQLQLDDLKMFDQSETNLDDLYFR